LAAGGAYLGEAAVVVKDFHAVAVLDQPGFLIDSGYAIAQTDLHTGDVSDFEHLAAAVFAGGKEENGRHAYR
jgi:hypothetical protein